jgi:hypothetical protein
MKYFSILLILFLIACNSPQIKDLPFDPSLGCDTTRMYSHEEGAHDLIDDCIIYHQNEISRRGVVIRELRTEIKKNKCGSICTAKRNFQEVSTYLLWGGLALAAIFTAVPNPKAIIYFLSLF